ncbi:MAG: hypothetical protein WD738_17950 [Pirellulales bacterium]
MECRLEGVRNAPSPWSVAKATRYSGGVLAMPFPLIPTALGVCFFLIWVFIGGMIFRDGQLAAQREREFNNNIWPVAKRMRRREAA